MRQAPIFLLCLLAASAYGASLRFKSGVHSDLCEWGPQYWCSSEQTAGRCGKTKYCQENDWTQELIRDERCTATQNVVKSARSGLDNKPIKQVSDYDIAMILARVCSTEKDQLARMLCKDIVTDSEILPKLIKLVLSRLPTMSVAIAVGGCRHQEVQRVKCETECGQVIKTLQMSAGTVFTRDHYMKMFKPACAKTGMAHQVCEAMAQSNYEKFVKGITSANPSEMCPRTSTCLKESSMLKGFKVHFTECSMCKDVVSEIRAMTRSSEIQSAVRNLMKSACTYLGEFKDLCDTLADEGLTYVYEIIASEMEPEVVCEKLSLCMDPEKNAPALPNFEDSEDELCELCEYLVTYLDGELKKNATIEDIKKLLNTICTELPAALKNECETLVKQYFPLLQAFLEKGFPPKQACQGVKMCPPSWKSNYAATPKVNTAVGMKDTTKCSICELVVTELSHVLSEKSTAEEIDAALLKVCTILPEADRDTCSTIIETYAPLILQLIAEELDPSSVCKLLRLCPSSKALPVAKVEGGELCTLCELVMRQLDGILKEKSTEQEIETALDQVCQMLPASLTTECDSLIKQYTPQLIQLLLQVSPDQVCSMLGLCASGSKTLTVQALPVHKVKDNELCSLCEFAMQELDSILKENSTEQDIETALDQVCQLLPASLKSECDALIKQYTPQLIQLLLQFSPDQVCSMLGLCASGSKTLTVQALPVHKVKDNELCSLCEFAMQELDSILKENSTEQEIERALDQVCQLLPASLKSECDALIKQYTPQLIQLLLQFSPDQVCSMLGLCASGSKTLTVQALPVHKVKDNELCSLCELAMQELDSILKENSTEQEIERALDQVCQLLPASLKSECDALIKQYTPQLIQLLLQFSPDQVCSMLGLCASGSKTVTVMNLSSSRAHKVKAGELCVVCEFVIQELDGILKENSTQQEIMNALEQVCQFLPATLKTDCDTLVLQYTPILVQLLLQYTPEQVCTMLELCTSTQKALRAPVLEAQKVEDGELCVLCEFAMRELDGILKKNSTEGEIAAALDQVCQILPATLRTECDALIKEYTPVLIEILLGYSPSEVCTMIGICKSQLKVHVSKMDVSSVRNLKADPCPICELVMQQLDSFLGKNKTEQSIEAALDQVCDLLPGTVKTECENLVKQYTPTLISLLLAYSPQDVCKLLGLCPDGALSVDPSKMDVSSVKNLKAEFCPICELVIKEVDRFLGNNKTEQSVEAALDQVCDLLPGTVKTECENLVKQYTPTLISLLLAYSPQDVCKLLGLCPDGALSVGPIKNLKAEFCPICELVIKEVDRFLGNNKTEQSVEAALDQVCDLLPGTVKTECENLVKQYTPTLISLLLAYSPQDVCKLLGLCPDGALSVSPIKNLKAEFCPICELVIKEVDRFLGNNKTEQSVEAALDQVCDLLPGTVKTECENLVKQYTPTLISLLLAYSPQDVCKLLGLCPDGALSVGPIKNLKAEFCPICELVIKEVDRFLGNNKTEQSVEAALDQVCDLLPGTVKTECENLVKQYTPTLISLLLAYSPQDVCKLLGVCPDGALSVGPIKNLKAEFCPICELVIKEVDRFLGNNKTEQSVEAALDQVCDLLPGTVKTECENLVKQYTPTLISLLLAYSPQDVCKLLGLCPDGALSVGPIKNLKAEFCPICELVIEDVDSFLGSNKTEQSVEAALDQVCDFFSGAVKTECDILVKQYTPTLIQLLLSYSPKDVCKLAGFCPAMKVKEIELSVPRKMKSEAGPLCALCEFVITQLDGILQENSTEQQIEAALESVCQLLPATLKPECDSLVQQYAPFIVKLLVSNLQPKQVCTTLALCTMTQKHVEIELSVPRKMKSEAGPLCALCEFVITQLDGILQENSTEQQIEAALESVCQLLPATLKPECDSLVQQYAPFIVKLLVSNLQPKQVCTTLALCTMTQKHVDALELSRITKQVEAKKSTLCTLCTLVFTTVDRMVDSNGTKQEAIAVLDKVCDVLPAAIKSECEPFVTLYAPYVLDLVVAKFTPAVICQYLQLCTNSTATISETTALQTKTKPVGESELCTLCQYVLQYLDNILANNSTEAEIEQALKYVCDVVPASLTSECNAFIHVWTPQLIAYVLQEVQPKEICVSIGFCNAHEMKKSVEVKPVRADGCTICQTVLSTIDQVLKDNATRAEIEKALTEVCSILPDSIKSDCNKYIQQYYTEIVNLLLDFPPSEICRLINLCPSNNGNGASLMLKRVNSEGCTICQTVLTYVDQFLKNEATRAEIEKALTEVCSIVPDSIKSDCNKYIQQYYTEIVNLLLDFPPSEICRLINLCPSNNGVFLPEALKCDLCEMVIKQLESMISSTSSEDEIETALEKVCSFLPSSLKTDCDGLVETYTPTLIKLLLQETRPRQVCIEVGVCTDAQAPKAKQVALIVKFKDESCELCTMVMSELDSLLSDKSTQDEISNALDFVCTRVLPQAFSDECVKMVDSFIPVIVQFLTQDISPKDVCTVMGLCQPSSLKSATLHEMSIKAGPLCPLCELVAQNLDNMLKQNSTQAQIEQALEQVCNLLPATLKKECVSLVVLFSPQIVDLLVKEMNPSVICKQLNLCTNASVELETVKANGLECDLCEMVIGKVKSMVSSKSSEAEIESVLKKVCSFLPSSVESECNTFVDQYLSLIIDLVLKDLTAEEICEQLKMCPSAVAKTVKSNFLECDLCEMVIGKVKSMVSSKSSEAEIESVLKKVCSFLPSTVESECNTFVDQYLPLIIELVLKDMTSEEICEKLKMCPSTATRKNEATLHEMSIKAGPLCPLCELVAQNLDNMLKQNSTQAQIEQALEQVCNLLPATLKKECLSLVVLFSPQIVDLLVKEMDPSVICKQLNLCTNASIEVETKNSNNIQCDLCEKVINKLKSEISSKSSQAEIDAALKKACSVVSQMFQRECQMYIDTYGPMVVKLILEGASTEEICQKLGMCPVKSGKGIAAVSNVQTCTLCEFALEEVKGFVKDKPTVAALTEGLQYVCQHLPEELAKLKTACVDLAIMFGPDLVVYFDDKIAPKQMCQAVHLCPPPKPASVEAIELNQMPMAVIQPSKSLMFQPEKKNQTPDPVMPDCSACKFALYEVQTALATPFWQEESSKILNLLCDRIEQWPDVCHFMVKQNLPKIISQARGFRFPIEFCQDLQLCEPPKPASPAINMSPMERCDLCDRLVRYMGYSSNKAPLDAESVCGFLVPQEEKPLCLSLVQKYSGLLMELLKKHQDPYVVCQVVNVCPKSSAPKPFVMKAQPVY